jgi:hypothetical protein
MLAANFSVEIRGVAPTGKSLTLSGGSMGKKSFQSQRSRAHGPEGMVARNFLKS